MSATAIHLHQGLYGVPRRSVLGPVQYVSIYIPCSQTCRGSLAFVFIFTQKTPNCMFTGHHASLHKPTTSHQNLSPDTTPSSIARNSSFSHCWPSSFRGIHRYQVEHEFYHNHSHYQQSLTRSLNLQHFLGCRKSIHGVGLLVADRYRPPTALHHESISCNHPKQFISPTF